MGIKDELDKKYEVDQTKIGKMASVDIASGGVLPLPEKGESINVRILTPPKQVKNEKLPKGESYTARCVIYGKEQELQYDFWVSSTIYKGMLAEMQKAKIPVDSELKCLTNRIFTIAGRDWSNAPKEMWKIDDITKKSVSPKTYSIALRLDLEARGASVPSSEGTAPELMQF